MNVEPSFFLHFLICLTLSIKLSLAADIITPSSFISDGEKLISSSERFELGFFSPGKSKYRYLGIWYKQIPDTVVWVANRNSPIFYPNAALTISKDGNLVILNQTNGTIWSSNTSRKAENPVAQLLDNGNLVLRDNFSRNTSENYLWQSFDNPTDTLLQGMKLGWDLKTGLERYQISWSSADDPSPGNFIHRLDIHVLPQLCIYNRSVKLACTGPRNGHAFAVSPFNFLYVPTIVDKEGEIYYSYDSYNSPIIMIIKISPSGKLQQLVWKERTSMWEVYYTGPSYFCQIYGSCGANSVCSTNKIPNCECLMGFKLKSQHNQTRPATCVRSHSSDCKSGDRFVKLDDMKLPDLAESSLNESMGLKDCETECLKNCSCRAYANSKVTGGGSGCLMWFGDLVDIRKAVNHDNAQPLYIRVPASVLDVGNKKILWIIVILAAILFPAFYIFCERRRKLQEKETMTGQDMLQFDIRMSITTRENEFCQENISANGNIRYSWFPMFSLASICAATGNFSMENKLGEGGFGSVYKGRLLNGQEVAVKRLSSRSGQGVEEFKNELILIAKLQHRNLVRLLGCCTEREENILIYEYMLNKSLDFFLFDPTKSLLLGWRTRIKIIEGVAQGLLYLHQYSRLTVIHRDLKASNILLDGGMNSKISDFGMARVFGGDELQSRTKRIVGTYGYMSPEYALRGFFSIKSDVFSFGVLLFEILSGKKNTQFYNTDSLTLLGHAWDLWKVDRALDLMDPTLENEVSYPTLIRYINVALLCVHENAADRPTMSEVVSMLTNENLVLPSPKQPAFSYVRSLKNSKQPESKPEASSVNNVTVSLIGAR